MDQEKGTGDTTRRRSHCIVVTVTVSGSNQVARIGAVQRDRSVQQSNGC